MRGAAGLQYCVGMKRVMASVMGRFQFDGCEAGDAEERVGLDLQPLVGNVSMTVAALSVVFRPHELQRTVDMSKPVEGSHLHLHGDILFEISRGLVGRVRIQLRGRLRGQGKIGAGEEYRTLLGKFLPQISATVAQRQCRRAG